MHCARHTWGLHLLGRLDHIAVTRRLISILLHGFTTFRHLLIISRQQQLHRCRPNRRHTALLLLVHRNLPFHLDRDAIRDSRRLCTRCLCTASGRDWSWFACVDDSMRCSLTARQGSHWKNGQSCSGALPCTQGFLLVVWMTHRVYSEACRLVSARIGIVVESLGEKQQCIVSLRKSLHSGRDRLTRLVLRTGRSLSSCTTDDSHPCGGSHWNDFVGERARVILRASVPGTPRLVGRAAAGGVPPLDVSSLRRERAVPSRQYTKLST